ncbi:two-component system regulatory protein YycI [Brevibacillus ginsengisoli]|uniref:two-component system regulatory protein YycI n=1 Tax=Brevibacillus ginsengisoli TaxID=363854 RepID=UPI003CEF0680
MDWSKAKTVLIWAFLLLDMFLGYQVYASRTQHWMDHEVNSGQASDVESYLASKQITLQVEVPQETREMNYINVEYLGFDSLMAKEMPGQQITLEKNGLVSKFVPPIPAPDRKNPDEFLRQINQKIMYSNQYRQDIRLLQGNKMLFWQIYDGIPVYVAPLEIYLKNDMAIGYRQTYVQIRNQGAGRQVISAYTALRSLVDKELIQSGEKITDVELGYFGHEYDADLQVLAPVWRFIHNGKIHFVNGFTGAIEQPLTEKR